MLKHLWHSSANLNIPQQLALAGPVVESLISPKTQVIIKHPGMLRRWSDHLHDEIITASPIDAVDQ
jgi:hypothetical protein